MGDPNLWGTLEWGTNNWGTDNDTRWSFFKNLASETMTLADTYSLKPIININFGSVNILSTMSTLCHFDGYGDFKYVRAGDLGDDSFNKTADGSDSWSKTSDGSDTWGIV